jgi:PAS domain S-box-containing protein
VDIHQANEAKAKTAIPPGNRGYHDKEFAESASCEGRFRLLVDSVIDYAIFMLDTQGRITSWNAGAESIKGYRAEEILGRHFSLFYTEEGRRLALPAHGLVRAAADGSYSEEGYRVRKDGTQFWASVVITVLKDLQGRPIAFAKVTRDLTKRREAEERLLQSEERLRLLVDSVREHAIFMLDSQGRVTTWNSEAAKIAGYSANEAMGRPISLFYLPEDVATGQPDRDLQLARSEGRYEGDVLRVRKSGQQFWANVVISAVYNESHQLLGFAEVTRDLTDRRRIEQEAREAERVISRERASAIEAHVALMGRDAFISMAAHELRTPLTALQMKLESAQRMVGEAEFEPHGSTLSRIRNRLAAADQLIHRLVQLTERFLDVSRIAQGTFTVAARKEFDLTALVSKVVEDFRERARKEGSDLFFHATGVVMGVWDKTRIEQVIAILLTNAIKYGARKAIDVGVSGADTTANIVVSDNGIGIDAEDVERIFLRFERAVSVKHYGGMGLGLYSARHVVEAHEGTIRVSRSAGLGATFTITMPRRRCDD